MIYNLLSDPLENLVNQFKTNRQGLKALHYDVKKRLLQKVFFSLSVHHKKITQANQVVKCYKLACICLCPQGFIEFNVNLFDCLYNLLLEILNQRGWLVGNIKSVLAVLNQWNPLSEEKTFAVIFHFILLYKFKLI